MPQLHVEGALSQGGLLVPRMEGAKVLRQRTQLCIRDASKLVRWTARRGLPGTPFIPGSRLVEESNPGGLPVKQVSTEPAGGASQSYALAAHL